MFIMEGLLYNYLLFDNKFFQQQDFLNIVYSVNVMIGYIKFLLGSYILEYFLGIVLFGGILYGGMMYELYVYFIG